MSHGPVCNCPACDQKLPWHVRHVCHTSVDDARQTIRGLGAKEAEECLAYLKAGKGSRSKSLVKMLETRLRVLAKGAKATAACERKEPDRAEVIKGISRDEWRLAKVTSGGVPADQISLSHNEVIEEIDGMIDTLGSSSREADGKVRSHFDVVTILALLDARAWLMEKHEQEAVDAAETEHHDKWKAAILGRAS